MSHSNERRASTLTTSSNQLLPINQRRQSTMPQQQHSRKMSVFSHKTNASYYNQQKEKPTYQLEPTRRFDKDLVETIIKDRLDNFVSTTDAAKILSNADVTRQLSDVIRQKVKAANFDRYKVISYVVTGENLDQALQVASNALWNQATDDYASVAVVKENYFVVAMVFGVYLD